MYSRTCGVDQRGGADRWWHAPRVNTLSLETSPPEVTNHVPRPKCAVTSFNICHGLSLEEPQILHHYIHPLSKAVDLGHFPPTAAVVPRRYGALRYVKVNQPPRAINETASRKLSIRRFLVATLVLCMTQ